MTTAFALSEKDLKVLSVVHPVLEKLVKEAAKHTEVPFMVFEGVRTLARQKKLKRQGKSKTLRSRHLTGHAVDLVPLLPNKKGKLQPTWDVAGTRNIAAAMFRAGLELKLSDKFRWGGTWRTDAGTTEDLKGREDGSFNRFYDGPHFELLRKVYGDKPVKRTRDYQNAQAGRSVYNQTRTKTQSKFDGRVKTQFAESVQKALNEFGIKTDVDGFYGDTTRKNVALMQKRLGLGQDGLWGGKTSTKFHEWRRLKATQKPVVAPAPKPVVPPTEQPTPRSEPVYASAPLPQDANPDTHSVVSDDKSTRPVKDRGEALDDSADRYDANPPEIKGPLKDRGKSSATNSKGLFNMDGKKTYILVAVGIALAVAEGVFGLDIPGFAVEGNLIEYVIGLLGIGTLRHGVAKSGS